MPFDADIDIIAAPDVRAWAETAQITSVEFRPSNFLVRHTKEGTRADSWPGAKIPGWGDGGADKGEIQWTLWVIIQGSGGRWMTSGCIEYWAEAVPTLGVDRGGGAPFSDAARNWYYQVPGMAGNQPGPGARIGVMAVAGDQRAKDIRSVMERSNVAWVTVPANNTGRFDFPVVAQPAPSLPAPSEAPPTDVPPEWQQDVLSRLTNIEAALKALGDPSKVVRVGATVDCVATVKYFGEIHGKGTITSSGSV